MLSLLGGVVTHAERDGVLDKVLPTFVNPFNTNMQLRSEDREDFDRADLKVILTSPAYSADSRPDASGGEATFWFPLIALLCGMRLDERLPKFVCR